VPGESQSENPVMFKTVVAIALGLAGFAVNLLDLDVGSQAHGTRAMVGLFFPMIVALAWGWRFGLLSATLGLGCQNGWFLLDGLMSVVTVAVLSGWIVWHGWCAERYAKEKVLWQHSFLAEIPARLVISALFMIVFAGLVNGEGAAPKGVHIQPSSLHEAAVFVLAQAVNGYVVLLFADVALNLGFVRQALRLPERFDQASTTHIVSASILVGCAFWVVDSLLDFLLFFDGEGSLLELFATNVPPHEIYVRTTFFVFCLIAGRVTSKVLRDQRQGEIKFRAITENTGDLTLVLDGNANHAYVSPSVQAVFGFTPSEILGRNTAALIHDEDTDRFDAFLRSIGDQPGATLPLPPFRMRHRDGRLLDMEGVATALPDLPGVNGTVINCRDVTERKAWAHALGESEERLRAVMDNSPAAIYLKDLEGRYLLINRNFEGWLRAPQEEVRGKTAYDFFSKVDADIYDRQDRRVRETKKTSEDEVVTLHPDSVKRATLVIKFPVLDGDGNAISVGGITLDISDVKQAEEERRESQERYRRLFTEMLSGFALHEIICDEDGEPCDYRFLEVNPAFERLTGLRPQDVVGRTVLEAMPGTEESWIKAYGKVALSGEPAHFENYAKELDAYFEVVAFCPEPGFFAVTFTDVSERRRAEETVRRLNEELEERVRQRTAELAAANEEMEAFTYSVSHDLRAPLRHMDGFSAALMEDFGDKLDGQAETYLGYIREGSQEMGRLIDGLLTLSRATRGDLERDQVDLSAMAGEIASALRHDDPGRSVEVEIGAGLTGSADPRLIRDVLQNLLGNAWKFTRDAANPRIDFRSHVADGETIFRIKDNGAGFDMAFSDKLFYPFHRLHRVDEFEGTGIGLSTVQRIIHRHGGRVWAEGKVGQGASVYFTL
jgi:PAS domain S-box-containing protein